MQQTSFAAAAARFPVIFFDSYGVLRNHNGLIPGAESVVEQLRAAGKHLRVLTNNAARSPESAAQRLVHYGLTGIPSSEIITSGATTRHFLEQKVRYGKVAYLGTEAAASYIVSAGLEAVPISAVDVSQWGDIRCVAFLDDEGYDLNRDLNRVINLLRHRVIPVVVANTDLLYPVDRDNVALATGGIARLAEYVLGRKFTKFGKPASQMFQLALDSVAVEFPDITPADILMVGDTLHTDILGANSFGITTALVLSGNTRREDWKSAVELSGIIPDFICESIGS